MSLKRKGLAMSRDRLFSRLLLTLLVGVFAGCQHIKSPVVAFSDDGDYLPGTVGDGLVISPEPYIPDVPMPVGFKAVASQSTSSFDGRVRTVSHYYQGRAKRGQTLEFYRANLPRNDWQFVNSDSVADATTLNYTKGAEHLAVTIRHANGVANVTIQIGAR